MAPSGKEGQSTFYDEGEGMGEEFDGASKVQISCRRLNSRHLDQIGSPARNPVLRFTIRLRSKSMASLGVVAISCSIVGHIEF